MMYPSFRALFPPKARPGRSSLLTRILGPFRCLVRLGRGYSGVGVNAKSILGRVLSLMGVVQVVLGLYNFNPRVWSYVREKGFIFDSYA